MFLVKMVNMLVILLPHCKVYYTYLMGLECLMFGEVFSLAK